MKSLILKLALLILLAAVHSALSAVPDGPRSTEGSRQLTRAVDCTGVVIFSAASVPKNGKSKSMQNQMINFEELLIDKSIGFSKESGVFTTHCPGLYQFTFTAAGDDARFSLRKRPSASTTSWHKIAIAGKSAGSHVVFLNMEIGEQVAVFVDTGSLSAALSHSFSGYRVSKK